ncbi:hypothetical protein [Plasmodium yoelii yoelii]|uniref:Fam-a protein n=2 Tax=Plasmodium yoelii yoelii TaxID=73239 RepID=A0AAE9WW59_PLAYO|nr:hypothetical protein [Plasmodium yoelii yoelii]WBY59675.1 fam-a protein [Plasmodium yoelii yoelii]
MNKFYIQIVLFLLTISLYVNNKTLATEPAPVEDATPESKEHYLTSEEIYEKNKDLLCTNPKETAEAVKLMDEVVTHLEQHATSINDYKLWGVYHTHHLYTYLKKHEGKTKVEKNEYKVFDSNKYNEVINELWDTNNINPFNNVSFERKIVRVYNPNLVLIQQRYKKKNRYRRRYFYALATKVEISENITIIAYASANINDHNISNKECKNEIVPNANLFKTDIDSEEDIRNGKLKKKMINIAGYIIEKGKWRVNITHVKSVSDIKISIT